MSQPMMENGGVESWLGCGDMELALAASLCLSCFRAEAFCWLCFTIVPSVFVPQLPPASLFHSVRTAKQGQKNHVQRDLRCAKRFCSRRRAMWSSFHGSMEELMRTSSDWSQGRGQAMWHSSVGSKLPHYVEDVDSSFVSLSLLRAHPASRRLPKKVPRTQRASYPTLSLRACSHVATLFSCSVILQEFGYPFITPC